MHGLTATAADHTPRLDLVLPEDHALHGRSSSGRARLLLDQSAGAQSAPDRRRVWAVPAVVVALLLPNLPALVGSSTDGASRALLGVLGTYLPVVALLTGGLLCCLWWLGEQQGAGRLAAAMLGLGLTTLPSQLAAAQPGSPIWGPRPTLGAVVATVAMSAVLLTVGHRVTFRHRVEPVVLGGAVGVTFGVLAALASGGDLGRWAQEPVSSAWPGTVVGLLVGAAGVVLLGRVTDLPVWARREMQIATGLLVVSWLAIHDASTGLVEMTAAVAALTAMVLFATTSAQLLVIGLRDGARTRTTLSDRAVTAEGRVDEDEELMHEVRSTVAGINATTQILYRPDHDVTAVHQDRLQYLLIHEIDRLNRMISHHGERPETVDVDEVLDPLVSSFRYLGMTIDWRPGGVTAYACPSAVAELLQILLTNASKHAAGSAVQVATRVRDGVAEIEVTDDGPGVAPSQRERIFQRGARGTSSRGHGLGLYIARRLAAQQGGSLTLHPESTEGASFRVHLPLTGGAR